MVGICVGFLLHNWHPAKLFMGDSGSMLLGYLITCASIVMTGRLDPASIHASIYLPVFMPILLPILVLFLPVLDMCLAIVRRLAKGQSPMHPDRMHLHHRMLKIGHSVRGAVLILWGRADRIRFADDSVLQSAACGRGHAHRRGGADHSHDVPLSAASYSRDPSREPDARIRTQERAACYG